MTDNVNSPSHYARFRFTCEPKDFTKFLPHPLASAIEYIIRAPHKGNELEDLEKAAFWLNELLETRGFWVLRTDSEGYEYRVLLLPTSIMDSEFYAAAWALMSQVPFLEEFLCGAFPGQLTKKTVTEMLYALQDKVRELKIKAGIDPIEIENQGRAQ